MRKNTVLNEEQFALIIEQFYSYFETGYSFEEFLKIYLEKIGLDEVTITQRARDGGIDLRAKRNGIGDFSETDSVEYYIQAKRYKPQSTIPVRTIRELKGTIPFGVKGIFITTAKFSLDAKKESNNDISKPVILIDGRSLIESCIENELGFSFVPQFSKIEMDRLTMPQDADISPQETITTLVEKRISANDIRAQILRIPKAIINLIPPEVSQCEVCFNGGFMKTLSIDKHRVYFAKVIDIYRKYGLIDSEGVFYPTKAIWTLDTESRISITLQDVEHE